MTLTNEQIKTLHKAIDLAVLPGGCQYVTNDAPSCVIAQLATLEGAPLEILKMWNVSARGGDSKKIGSLINDGDPTARRLGNKYGDQLLIDLQEIWDSFDDKVILRERMRQKVAANSLSN